MEWYGHHNSTTATFNTTFFCWAFSWCLIYIVFLWFALTSRTKKKQTLFLGTLSLSAGALLSLGIVDCNWLTGGGSVKVTYSRWSVRDHGKSDMLTEGKMSVHIGLRNVNVTFTSSPDAPFFYYNEEFEIKNKRRQDKDQFISSLQRGLPNAILIVMEFLQHNACNGSFEQTGYLANYFLNACFIVWLANQVIFLMVPEVSAQVSFYNAALIIFTTVWYVWRIDARHFVITVEGNPVPVTLGRSLYCTAAAAFLQTIPIILVKMHMFPRTSFEVDYDTPWDKAVIKEMSTTAKLNNTTTSKTTVTESILKTGLKEAADMSINCVLGDITAMQNSTIGNASVRKSSSSSNSSVDSVCKPPKLNTLALSSPTSSILSLKSESVCSVKSVRFVEGGQEKKSPSGSPRSFKLPLDFAAQTPTPCTTDCMKPPAMSSPTEVDIETPRRKSPLAPPSTQTPIQSLVFANNFVVEENEKTPVPARLRRASIATESASRRRPLSMSEWKKEQTPFRQPTNSGSFKTPLSNEEQLKSVKKGRSPKTSSTVSKPSLKGSPSNSSKCERHMPSPIKHTDVKPPGSFSQVNVVPGSPFRIPKIHATPRRRHTVSDGLGGDLVGSAVHRSERVHRILKDMDVSVGFVTIPPSPVAAVNNNNISSKQQQQQ